MAHTIYKNKEGIRVPSCTTVIDTLGWNKNILLAWTRKLALSGIDPRKTKQDAGETGTLTHKMIEAHIFGATLDVSQYSYDAIVAATDSFQHYKRWEEENQIKYIESELMIVSEDHQWGGTIDALCTINNKQYLIDFKTSKNVYVEHLIQVSAYTFGAEECGYKIDGVKIIHIVKDDINCLPEKRIVPIEIPGEIIRVGYDVFCNLRTQLSYKAQLDTFIKTLHL